MVRKREDGRWEGRIVVGHKENGEPIFRYVLAKTQKELLAKLHRDIDIYQDAQLTEDSRMTLGEWLDRWMEEYGAVTLRPNTLRSYEQYIRCYVKPYLGGKIVSRVTRLEPCSARLCSTDRGSSPVGPVCSAARTSGAVWVAANSMRRFCASRAAACSAARRTKTRFIF